MLEINRTTLCLISYGCCGQRLAEIVWVEFRAQRLQRLAFHGAFFVVMLGGSHNGRIEYEMSCQFNIACDKKYTQLSASERWRRRRRRRRRRGRCRTQHLISNSVSVLCMYVLSPSQVIIYYSEATVDPMWANESDSTVRIYVIMNFLDLQWHTQLLLRMNRIQMHICRLTVTESYHAMGEFHLFVVLAYRKANCNYACGRWIQSRSARFV